MSTAPPWCYNKRLRMITHGPRMCDLCASWAHHYLEHVLNNDPSLYDAEHERDASIIGNLKAERETLLANNAALRKQLSNLNTMLDESISQKEQAQDELQNQRAQLNELTEAAGIILKVTSKRRKERMVTVDLHGLTVPEAIQYATKEIESASQRENDVVRFIVGKGLHCNVPGDVKIRPALQDLCDKRGLTHHLDPKNTGCLIVKVR